MMANRKNFKQTQLGQIPEAWETISLGQICNIETGNTDTKDAVEDGRYPLFDRSQEVKRSDKYLFDCAAVIVPGEGKDFTPTFYDGKFDLHQRAYAIWSEEEYINPKYLYYAISTFKKQLSKWAVGSTVRSLRMGIIEQFQIPFPPVKEQEKIADVLSSLDDKIELNRKMNQTLEEMGKALFKHWFVDFEFPCLPENYKFSGAGKPPDMESVCTYKSVGGLPVPQSGKWFVYILLCKDESFYIGMTNDLYYRWYQHKTGQGVKWTKVNEPVKVIHYEEFSSKEEAAKGKKELKTGYGRKWLKREYTKLKQSGSPAHKCKLMQAGKMVDSELGKIPKEWKVKSLDKIADYLNGLACQKYPPDNEGNALPVIKIAELRNGFTESSDSASRKVDKKYHVKNGDVLFSWSGSLEVCLWPYEEGILNQHLFKVTSRQFPKWFYYLWTLHHLDEFRIIASGKVTTMGHIQRKHLTNAKVLVPDKKTLKEMSLIITPVVNQLTQNNREINNLRKIKDSLLPRLMIGKLRIKKYD